MCTSLCEIGLNARIAELGLPEEDIGKNEGITHGKSLGLIEVQDSPIRWVNILKSVKRKMLGVD